MRRHEGGCLIEEAGRPIGVACERCGKFWECAVLASADGELVAAVLPGEEDGCSDVAMTNETWEKAVQDQVRALGLKTAPQ